MSRAVITNKQKKKKKHLRYNNWKTFSWVIWVIRLRNMSSKVDELNDQQETSQL